MLYEICCDKFAQKQIKFNESLSVVLGTNDADNSIGKSTFLLIVDFVFGGDTYTRKEDIIKSVGNHDIFWAFKFNNQIFKFCRNNSDTRFVWKCDDNYKPIEKIELEKYYEWLKEQYNINLPDLSFRNIEGRYIRVYGKDNCDENHPLHYLSLEKNDAAIYSLIKLFNRYIPIKNIKEKVNETDEELKAYRKAQKLEFIAKITKAEYEQNKKYINQIDSEISNLTNSIDNTLLDVDVLVSEEAIELKNSLSRAKRHRTKLQLLLNSLEDSSNYKFSISKQSLDELKDFFPTVNIRHIEEIEEFHRKISSIFKNELQAEQRKLEKEISKYDTDISEYNERLKSLINNPSISKIILSKHARLLKDMEIKQNQNKAYEKLEDLISNNDKCIENLREIESKQLGIIESDINQKMKTLNDIIYEGTCNPPIIHFSDSKYSFFTENDTGTGIAYKGLVLFDLSILNLTPLPILVHDSVILKPISDMAIGKIMKLYTENNKQVIIALDKQSSYGKETEELLNKHAVLKLASGGQELFGRSWG